jgi:hypothetical protein
MKLELSSADRRLILFAQRFIGILRMRRVWITAAVLFAVFAAWIFRPYPHAEESLIDPHLRALRKPYRSVSSAFFFDEGSSGIKITDAHGDTEEFFIPYLSGHRKVYIMLHQWNPERFLPASNHAATLQELIAVLSEYCDSPEDRYALWKMSGRWRDEWRVQAWQFHKKLMDWWDPQKF